VLGRSCAACQFFNAHSDEYCGGCGKSLEAAAGAGGAAFAASAGGTGPSPPVHLTDDMGFGDDDLHELLSEEPAAGGEGVSPETPAPPRDETRFDDIDQDPADKP